ncbi:hypothetical protein MHH56_32755 [Paenibacillus sp. FSL K6-3182]
MNSYFILQELYAARQCYHARVGHPPYIKIAVRFPSENVNGNNFGVIT